MTVETAPALAAMRSKYPWPTVLGVGEARSHAPTVFFGASSGGGRSPLSASKLRRKVTTTMPAARIVSFSPRSEITAGFGPAGTSGASSRTGTKPFSSSTTRTSLGVVSAGGGAAVRMQAARHAAQSTATGRRSGTEAPKLDESRPAATSKGRVAAILAALVLAAGYAPRPLLERAIRARGGPLASMARQVEAEVYLAFPGTWRWRTVYM